MNELNLTGLDIRELANLAGYTIVDDDYADEDGTEITIKTTDGFLQADDGSHEYYPMIAYFTDYPDEGAIGIGELIKREPAK